MSEVHEKTPLEIQLDEMNLSSAVKFLHSLRYQLDSAEETASILRKKYDWMSINYIPVRMETEGVESLKVDGVGRINIRADMWTQTLNTAALQSWLLEHDLEDLIVPSVNGSTFKAFLKEQLKKGNEIPDDTIVKITPYSRAVITKV